MSKTKSNPTPKLSYHFCLLPTVNQQSASLSVNHQTHCVESAKSNTNWSELKDIFRKCGKVTYTDAHQRIGEGRGEVCFDSADDLKAALKEMNGFEINGKKIEVFKTHGDDGSRSRSRSRGRRSRSRSASPRRSRSRSPKRSRDSRSRGRDRSDSRGRSRSRGRRSRS